MNIVGFLNAKPRAEVKPPEKKDQSTREAAAKALEYMLHINRNGGKR